MFLISLSPTHRHRWRSDTLWSGSQSAADSANRLTGGGLWGDKGRVGLMWPAWVVCQAKRWHKHSLKSNLIAWLCNLQLSTVVPVKTSSVWMDSQRASGKRLGLQRLWKSSELRVYWLGYRFHNRFHNSVCLSEGLVHSDFEPLERRFPAQKLLSCSARPS